MYTFGMEIGTAFYVTLVSRIIRYNVILSLSAAASQRSELDSTLQWLVGKNPHLGDLMSL